MYSFITTEMVIVYVQMSLWIYKTCCLDKDC